MNFRSRLQAIKDECNRREALREKTKSEIEVLKEASTKLQEKIEIAEKSKIIVSDISVSA